MQNPATFDYQSMPFRVEDARDLMITGLKNAHALEQQAIEMLERNSERLDKYPDLKARVIRHLDESREQQAMVAQCLRDLGESPSTLKDTVLGFMQNMQMFAHAAAPDEVIKNSIAGFAFEHFEIASYTALGVMAEAAGEPRVKQMADRILRQEKEMALWLEQNMSAVIIRHIAIMSEDAINR